ncbi:zinc metalloprotease [Bacillus thuringiensis]|uniref:Tolloid-like protein 1 n=1 Tax=Bacillus thuringiensis TaxID=1428 RepID=UPI002249444D|nr:Tolloid-like protein 1 [Bacillus thuringiensis]
MTTNQPLNHCVQMYLPDDQVIEATRLAIQENPDNAPDTDELSADSIDSFEMALVIGKKWRNGRTLRVRFLDGEPAVHEKIKRYANEWSRYANLKFTFGNDPDAEIRISLQAGGGFWSYIGTDNLSVPKSETTMCLEGFNSNTTETEISPVVLHQFGHVLGLGEEHHNPENTIPWDKEAVYRYYRERLGWSPEMVDLQVLAKLDPRGTAHTPHDPKSIMQFPVPNELTIGDYEIGWNTTLSEVDKRFIGQMYPF